MTAGSYAGGTFGFPFGGGLGLFIDNQGRAYPQLYGGSPRFSFSGGYTPDLEGLLTGPSVSWSPGIGSVRYNIGANTDTIGTGVGTATIGLPSVGITHGFGPLNHRKTIRDHGRSPPSGTRPEGRGWPAASMFLNTVTRTRTRRRRLSMNDGRAWAVLQEVKAPRPIRSWANLKDWLLCSWIAFNKSTPWKPASRQRPYSMQERTGCRLSLTMVTGRLPIASEIGPRSGD